MGRAIGNRRFRFAVRSLMIAVAVCALLLVPVVWVAQQTALVRAERMRAIDAERRARAEAARAQYVAQVRSAHARFESQAADPAEPPQAGAPARNRGGLWAALGVNHAVFRRGEEAGLSVEFTLVNDGEATIDPKIGESRIVVNGEELADSGLILGNGPRDARFAALPPGEHLRFGYALGEHFKEPGIYRVSWRGANFRSPEVVFRVLAKDAP
jgi:hypothetical protein